MSQAVVDEKTYLPLLEELKATAEQLPRTRLMSLAKITALILLNMRYERIMLDRHLKVHPYLLVEGFVRDAQTFLAGFRDVAFIERPPSSVMRREPRSLDAHHHELFQRLWIRFSPEAYQTRIDRYVHRLRLNKLNGRLKGMRCIDVGCGHGNFAHALVRAGAASVYGLDFGEATITYAIEARDRLRVPANQIEFAVGSVYRIPQRDAQFDFAVQNGVFHHLDNEDAAITELRRVLKPGGWCWYYTDGAGGISQDFWDASRHILRDVPEDLILSHLDYLNIDDGKRYHLGDGLNAVYRRTTWEELTTRLRRLGFGQFRRLVGGFPTDFDYDVIAADPYGREKFGEGDLRLLAQKTG